MPSSVDTALRTSTVFLVMLSYLALTSVSTFGVEVVLVAVAVLAAAPILERIDRKTPNYRRVTSTITLIFALVALPQMVLRLGVLVALTILCMYIQSYLLVHEKKVRDYQYIFLMAFFLVVSACAQNPEASLGLVVPFFILAIVWAFGMLQIRKDVATAPEMPTGTLLPVAERDRFVPAEGTVLHEQPRLISGNLTIYLAFTAAGCFLLSLAIFAVTPRMEVGMLGGSSINIRPSAVDDSVNLAKGGRIGSSTEPIMRVKFPDEPDGKYEGPLFWRVTALNRYLGSEWDRVRVDEQDFSDWRPRRHHDPASPVRRVTQEIYLDDPPGFGVPCLPYPIDAVATPRSSATLEHDRSGDFTIFALRRRSPVLNYEVLSDVGSPAPEALRKYPERFAAHRGQRGFPFLYERVMGLRSYNILTQEDLSEESRQLAQQITNEYDNPYDKASAIVQWFQGARFVYSLSVPSPGDMDPIEFFLHRTRAGNCELYASAMALMLRSLGIPARVVSGYRGGEWTPGDQAYFVRRNMAHMWVEVYFIDHGWVTFDPTPATDTETRVGAISRYISRNILNFKMIWFRDVVGYTGGIRMSDLRNLSLGLVWFDFNMIRETVLQRPLLSGIVPKIVLWGSLLAGAVAGIFLLIVRRPRITVKRFTFTRDQIRATRLFGRLKRRLRGLGAQCTGRTAAEIYRNLDRDLLQYAGPIGEVMIAYRDARFGGRPLDRKRYAALNRTIRGLGKTRGNGNQATNR